MVNTAINEPHKRLGVCLNAYSDNSQLIEEALAAVSRDGCSWFAIYIDDERHELDSISHERLLLSIDQAREAGAQIIRLPSSDVIQGIITAAEINHLTHLIIGRRRKSRLQSLIQPTVASRLLKHDTSFELQVMTLDQHSSNFLPSSMRDWRGCFVSIGLILLLTVIIDYIQESLPEYRFNASIYNVSMVYLLATIFSALRYGFWPAVFAAFLSFALYNYFFIPPFYQFGLGQFSDVINFSLFLGASLFSVTLADSYKRKMSLLKEREVAARALLNLTKEVGDVVNTEQIVRSMGLNLQEILRSEVAIFIENSSMQSIFSENFHEDIQVANDVYKSQKILHHKVWSYYPISTPRRNIGILAVSSNDNFHSEPLVEALAYQIGLAIERSELMKESEDIKLEHQRESLRSSLLSSVSHDLKTPLVSIIGSLSSIRHMDDALSNQERKELIVTAIEEAERLNQSISNILYMTKIESGDMHLDKQWIDVHSLFSDAVSRFVPQLGYRVVKIRVPDKALSVMVDPVLFSQVLQNLLENISKYTAGDALVVLDAQIKNKVIELKICDNGPGIPQKDQERLFDKFSRLESRDARVAGTGLGLSICKAIIELHDGTIILKNNEGGNGLCVIIHLKDYQSIQREQGE